MKIHNFLQIFYRWRFWLMIVIASGLGYTAFLVKSHIQSLNTSLSTNIQQSEELTSDYTKKIGELENKIIELSEENQNLSSVLTEEQKKNLALEREERRNKRKIDELEKLTTIDPELLKKYSKVFFLSENYSPPELEEIPVEFKITEDKDLKILEDVEPFLVDLLEDAQDSKLNLRVISAYRSFDEQKTLKSNYTVQYGSGANTFSADQGYSEHQLGTTVDFGTPEIRGAYMSFENTDEFKWLTENAYRYGFILSYPDGNLYYQYEPWHWRFVGKELAEDLFEDGKNFYELGQREIDEYLVEIFD